MPEDSTHECPKNGCHARVKRSQLLCPAHWRLVPVPVQRELYAAYRSGNLGRHVAAMQDCIDHVNDGAPRERDPRPTNGR